MSKDPLVSGNANLVPCVTNANVSLSAQPTSGGGGGGGYTPNPSFSTISMPPNGTILTGTGAQLIYTNDFAFNSATDDAYVLINHPANGATGLELQTPDGNHGVSLVVDGTAFYIDTFYNSDQIIIGRTVPTTISSLTVSSINGATPGGGGGSIPPTIQVSTIQFGDAGGGLSALDISNTHNITIQDSVTGALNDIQFNTNAGTAPNQYNNMVIYAPYAAQTVEVRASDTGVNSIATTSSLTIQVEEQLTLQGGGVSVQAPAGVTINSASGMLVNALTTIPQLGTSSITVSTINGASYPPSSSLYPYVSSINPGGGGGTQTQYFASTNQDVQVLTAFSTVVGHNYQLNLPFYVSTFQAPVYGEALQVFWQGVGATDLSMTIPLIQAGSYNMPLPFKNTVADGGVALLIAANTAYPVEINLGSSAGAELIDLGPSA